MMVDEKGRAYQVSKETSAMTKAREARNSGTMNDRLSALEDKIDRILSILNNRGN